MGSRRRTFLASLSGGLLSSSLRRCGKPDTQFMVKFGIGAKPLAMNSSCSRISIRPAAQPMEMAMRPLEAAQKRVVGWTGDANDANLAAEAVRVFLTAAQGSADTLLRAGIAINRLFRENILVDPQSTDRLAVAVIQSLLGDVTPAETLDSIGGEPIEGSGFEQEPPAEH
jgi:hypothetical protein